MAHEVQAKLGTIDISNKDLIIDIKKDSVKLGSLLISKGDVGWRKGTSKKRYLKWTEFAELMKSEGKLKPAKKKKDALLRAFRKARLQR